MKKPKKQSSAAQKKTRQKMPASISKYMRYAVQFIRQLPYPAEIFDTDGNMVMVNSAFRKYFKIRNSKKLIGNFSLYHSPLLRKLRISAFIERVYSGESVFVPKICIDKKLFPGIAGTTMNENLFVESIAMPLRDDGGEVCCLVAIQRDITTNEKTIESLKENQWKYQHLFSCINNGVAHVRIVFDRKNAVKDFVFLNVNPAYEKITGYSAAEITGKHAIKEVPGVNRKWLSIASTVLKKGKMEWFEYYSRFLDKWYRAAAYNIGTDQIVLILNDITEYKGIQARLQEGEERLRALLECSADIIQVVNAEGLFTYISPSVKRVLGYDPEELIGKPSVSVVHPDDIAEVAKGFENACTDPSKPVLTVCRCRHKNGSWRLLEGNGINHLNNPAVRGFVANIHDITDREKREAQIRESEEKFRNIVEQSHDGIVLIDSTGTIIEFNRSMQKIVGVVQEEALGKKIWDLQFAMMPKEVRTDTHYRDFRQSYLTGLEKAEAPWMNTVIENEVHRHDGSVIQMETVVFPIRVDTGYMFASINRDVTALRKTKQTLSLRERELSEQNVLLQQKNIALREVMAQLEEEKKRMRVQVQANADRLILPVIAKLRSRCGGEQEQILTILEENLGEITSAFGSEISRKMFRLTQKEIEICTLIRQGLSSKEISALLHIAVRTVETHRTTIRKKLEINDSSINLTTYLQNM
jgi:PAS domain S-box-containing protein